MAVVTLREMIELHNSTRLIDLSHRTLICVTGDDATVFLQGQLTQDVTALENARVLWAAHCSPKGRMLASFLMWKTAEAIWLDAPEDLAETALKRLRMYVLRSRVTVADARATQSRLGLCGPDLAAVLHAAACPTAPAPGTHDHQEGVTRVSISPERLLLVGPPDALALLQTRLAPICTPGHAQDWTDAAVREGVAEITLATQDQWIPQMLNWDLVGGISFKKGCYTGQEIVARTHYLGKVKRRLLRFRVAGPVEVGQELLQEGESVGKVALVGAPSAEGSEFLAVVQREALVHGTLHLGNPEGALVAPLPLPYPVAPD
ncbi:MAG: CAF17-like 4Fe-4S cluster assembly/insertion protein YgfZ [Burkholderiales bacterium]